MPSYTLSFLPLSFLGTDANLLNGSSAGKNGGNEIDYADKSLYPTAHRYGDVFTTGSYDDSAYVNVGIADIDGIFNDNPENEEGVSDFNTQVLTEPLTIGGKTYPAGTALHTGYRIEVDSDADGIADQTMWVINIGSYSDGQVAIGLASTKPIEPETAYKILGGGNSVPGVDPHSADIMDPLALYCFAAGTRIATPEGERAVETLVIGDRVCTADGREVGVRWIGRQRVHKAFTRRERFEPVRVRAGALSGALGRPGVPSRDLVLTADHALILDGLAINAGALVNGDSIAVVPARELPDQFTYYHIETEGHEVVLANGAPAETFLDQGDRRKFDNYGEYVALYGDDRRIAEMPLPRISTARLVPPSLRARLAAPASAPADAAA